MGEVDHPSAQACTQAHKIRGFESNSGNDKSCADLNYLKELESHKYDWLWTD